MLKKKVDEKIYIILFVFVSIILAVPSIIYLIKNKTIYKFYQVWTFFFSIPSTATEKVVNALVLFVIISVLFLLYFLIMKKNKNIFKNAKTIIISIFLVSIIFALIIPFTSTDVYSYIANGWANSKYNENPYYISTGEIADEYNINEPMFNKVANCWRYETVVYGPLWTFICRLFTSFSFGSIDIALMIFKIASIIVHVINSMLLYKITKRKLFMIAYGLNPFILFEAIAHVHNDIFIVLFTLLAIYFVKNKKNIFVSVVFLALAVAIKYWTILLLPFLVLYYVKDKDIKERIKYCLLCGIEFIAIIACVYLLYIRDLQVFAGLFIQQEKYSRSIFYILLYFIKNDSIINFLKSACLIIFVIYYIYIAIKILLQKEIKFYKEIRKYNIILFIFIFILITSFNSWYILWLIPTMFWLKPQMINLILALGYSSQIAYMPNFALYSEDVQLSIQYVAIMWCVALFLVGTNRKKVKG